MNHNYFEAIYARHVDTVFRIAVVYCKNEHDAQEIVQETFLKLLNTDKVFNDIEHEKAWLITVAINLSKNTLKHSWVQKISYFNDLMSYDEVSYEPHNKSPLLVKDNLLTEVLKLPQKYKTVIYLYYYEGYSIEEMASLLNIKVSTIKSQLHRARKLLKIQLDEVDYIYERKEA